MQDLFTVKKENVKLFQLVKRKGNGKAQFCM